MYHVYNRGVDKRPIFMDEQDYAVFLSFLKYALLPKDHEEKEPERILISQAQRFNLRRLEVADELDLVAFCLMPNHFHLLFYQHSTDAITRCMRSLATGYSMYFNKRYHRSGTLFQGRYRAVGIDSDAYWQHISRYIHLNPIDLGVDWQTYKPSSFRVYAGDAKATWLKPGIILDDFKSPDEYRQFVASWQDRHSELKAISKELRL